MGGEQVVNPMGGEQVVRKSTRERRQPSHLKDYEVQLNLCAVTSCLFTGALTEEEPACYEEAKGCLD